MKAARLLVAGVALLLAACGAPEPVRVGFIAELTGQPTERLALT